MLRDLLSALNTQLQLIYEVTELVIKTIEIHKYHEHGIMCKLRSQRKVIAANACCALIKWLPAQGYSGTQSDLKNITLYGLTVFEQQNIFIVRYNFLHSLYLCNYLSKNFSNEILTMLIFISIYLPLSD